MNKKEFSRKVAERHKMTYLDAKWATDAVFDTLAHVFDEDPEVRIQGFGTFKKIARGVKRYRDFKTGETLEYPPCNDVHLVSAPRLKALVNGETVEEEEEEQ